MPCLLEVDSLNAAYRKEGELIPVLEGVNLSVNKGESVGLIGESGSGKSTLSEAILNTLPFKGGEILCGDIWFNGKNLIQGEADVVGKNIAYIPQDPNSSLDPLFPVFTNFSEIIQANQQSQLKVNSDQNTVRILEKMGQMIHGIDLNCFPHQLSGGMKQRILIGIALQSVPELIIADEPTSNLDVTLERKIIDLFFELKEKQQVSFLLTTHNLALAKYFCDRIFVIYQGNIVESGVTGEIFHHPKHEYTKQLIGSIV